MTTAAGDVRNGETRKCLNKSDKMPTVSQRPLLGEQVIVRALSQLGNLEWRLIIVARDNSFV